MGCPWVLFEAVADPQVAGCLRWGSRAAEGQDDLALRLLGQAQKEVSLAGQKMGPMGPLAAAGPGRGVGVVVVHCSGAGRACEAAEQPHMPCWNVIKLHASSRA